MSKRRILLAVTGLSPQIVTETIYALTQRPTPWVPTEVHLISTRTGADNARLQLLSDPPGWFHRLREDYALPPIAFDADHIHIIRRADGSVLEDIRDDADHLLAADFICERVRLFTEDPESELHASLAGGRKTMGFFLGYAMSLYGRPQDRLSHVLVSEPFETQKDFFYPTPATRVIHDARTGLALDCHTARVWLGEIPFVRLREKLPDDLLDGRASYSETVAAVQENLPAAVRVVLRPATRELMLGDATIQLTPKEFAHYWVFADVARAGKAGMHWSEDDFMPMLLERLKRVLPPLSAEYEQAEQNYPHSYTQDYFLPTKSRINKKITQALGRHGELYHLKTTPHTKTRRYSLTYLALPPEVIEIEPFYRSEGERTHE